MTCLSVSKTVIYFENLCTSEIARVVQDDCNRVVLWIESSKLIINQIKTKSMLLGSWQNLAKSPDFCMKLYSLRSRRLNVLTVRKKERGVQGRHARGEKAPAREPKENVPPPLFPITWRLLRALSKILTENDWPRTNKACQSVVNYILDLNISVIKIS